jgi:hypothetical protein
MAISKLKDEEEKEALLQLREILEPNDTIYIVLNGESKSGMTRWINLYVIKDNKPYRILHLIAKALGEKIDFEKEGIKIGGIGYDVGLDVVERLNEKLKKTFKIDFRLKHEWL